MEISFTSEERELLVAVLEERHRELLREISRSTHNEFKVGLKRNEKLLQSAINKLHTAETEQMRTIPA
jgi:chemotaxis methyl-accepting protein methylase